MSGHLSADKSVTAATWHAYTSFVTAIDLTDGSQGPANVCARAIHVLTAGNLVVKRLDGAVETLTGLLAGFQLVGACSSIESSGSGTTVTAVIVYW